MLNLPNQHILVRTDNITAKAHVTICVCVWGGELEVLFSAVSVGGMSSFVRKGRTHKIARQHSGRLAQLASNLSKRMDLKEETFSGRCDPVWESGGGPFCPTSKLPSSEVLHPVSSSEGRSDRCLDFSLAVGNPFYPFCFYHGSSVVSEIRSHC